MSLLLLLAPSPSASSVVVPDPVPSERTELPLGLFVEIETADGATYKWDANQPDPGDRLLNISFSTKVGEGFSTLTGRLARRIDQDYPDLRPVERITVTGADGHIVFEGRLDAMPRELADSHSISVTFTGPMVETKGRRMSEVIVDRDLGAWGDMSAGRRATLLLLNQNPNGPGTYTDPTDSTAGVVTGFDGKWIAPFLPVAEAWYDAGPGNLVAKIAYTWERETTNVGTAAPWSWNPFVADDDKGSGGIGPGNLAAAGPSTSTYTPASAKRWAGLQLTNTATPAGAEGAHYGIAWQNLAVYGDHGLTTYEGEPGQPEGVYASDVIRYLIDKYCPTLNANEVQDTSWVIQHLKFDRVFPYDALLELNKYHLWNLAVWENRTLNFAPYDLSDYQWEIRTDDPGTTFAPVGQTTDDLFNGIEVIYQDILTGTTFLLTPDDYDDLRDTSDENPWNEWGEDHWDELSLSSPTTREQALQIGRAALAEKNRPKTPGTLTVQGYIRDRAGDLQPAYLPRAGEVIQISNFNEINRLIVETTYDADNQTISIAVDLPFQTLEALFDRQANALAARGLA